MKMDMWCRVKKYFSDRDGVVTRKQFLSDVGIRTTIIENYRCLLEKSGFIEKTGRGKYRRIRKIPIGLTVGRARILAYGGKDE